MVAVLTVGLMKELQKVLAEASCIGATTANNCSSREQNKSVGAVRTGKTSRAAVADTNERCILQPSLVGHKALKTEICV